ncbi:tRNA lysidine(34) synthetase TilS [Leeuwenhoekiella aequorea]|uniref:tRNA(Ile)-lysidine synthase n=1 Tax=Leeuwenhoekiella aequorea TaxID=283736 RepID=A0A4Q0P9F0_9FLAO|nr:tRNA lysidine(34) synthetase TilS [Leeuwenhoekiella aequorea]RXG23317.1 tRNA(Ile)-lysidine synthase [Leeuwenhoekiella aequorea]
MFDAFLNHISNNFPILFKSRVLLAVSGGIDSVVLLHLLKKADVDFAIAHCNFSLRGKESDQDAKFVEELARALNVPIYIQKFNTKAFALENKVSTQMAARELRYAWFMELCAEHNLSHTITAHHAQDDLETFLINISRASGIEGLTGMTENSDFILRPLLPYSRDQIAAYAEQHAINWREDSSNSTDNYLRNHLRHHAIPALNEASPDFLTQFKKTQTYLHESATLLEDYTAFLFSKIVTQSFKGYELNIPQLLEVPNTKLVLYQLLKGFEFTDWDTIYDLLAAQSGKKVIAGKHRLIRDRDVLLLTEHKVEVQEDFKVTRKDSLINIPGLTLIIDEASQLDIKDNNVAFFDSDQLEFPLTVRKWKEGDIFYPYGMHGKKKISKYFKDNKFSTLDKESAWLLCSGEYIIWIVGERTDNRYKIKSGTTKLVKFTVIYD